MKKIKKLSKKEKKAQKAQQMNQMKQKQQHESKLQDIYNTKPDTYSLHVDSKESGKRNERNAQFAEYLKAADTPTQIKINYNLFTAGDDDDDDLDWSNLHIIGTCEILEKKYLRLTSAPLPATVRPEHILKKSLQLILNKWNTVHDYKYIVEQFKSIRVQKKKYHLLNILIY
jgi:hypothetical protein